MERRQRPPLKSGERLLWLAILLLMMMAWMWMASCGRHPEAAEASAPLPQAFPRVYEYPDSFRGVTVGDVTLSVNAGAEVVDSAGSAFSIRYPRYGATVFVGVNSGIGGAEEFAGEWRNRVRRISLNLNGAPARKTTDADAGGGGGNQLPFAVYRAETVVLTPVQAVAGSPGAGVVVSAAAFMDGWQNSNVPYDSVRPVIDRLERDILRLVGTARYGN